MDDLATVAEAAVAATRPILRERFQGALDAEYTAGDVTTGADRAAERAVIEVLDERRPTDPISAEESGDHPGSGSVRWVVDPLDGTNNFAAGLPTFGAAVTAVEDGQPRATAVDLPIVGDRYVATPEACRRNGDRVRVDDGDHLAVDRATVAVHIGTPVIEAIRGDGDLDTTFRAIVADTRATTKRVIETWAPVVHYAQCARGRLDAVIELHPDERERVAGDLLTRASGCVRRDAAPASVIATHESLADRLATIASDASARSVALDQVDR
ncbi:MAG: inositol monophosphatase [Halococcoides sp.]